MFDLPEIVINMFNNNYMVNQSTFEYSELYLTYFLWLCFISMKASADIWWNKVYIHQLNILQRKIVLKIVIIYYFKIPAFINILILYTFVNILFSFQEIH